MTNGMTPEYAAQLKAGDGQWYFLNAGMRLTSTPNLTRLFNTAEDAQVLIPYQYWGECRIVRRYVTEVEALDDQV